MQNFSFLVHLDDTFAGGWLAGRLAGWPNLKIMLTSAQLGLAGAWAELGNITQIKYGAGLLVRH